eukprot:jgi/Bigna1/142137/aug1.67_g16845
MQIYLEEIPADAPETQTYNSDDRPPDAAPGPPLEQNPEVKAKTHRKCGVAAFQKGTVVEIVGLTKAVHYNGKIAVVATTNKNKKNTREEIEYRVGMKGLGEENNSTTIDSAQPTQDGRWAVLISSDKRFKLKEENLKFVKNPPPASKPVQREAAKKKDDNGALMLQKMHSVYASGIFGEDSKSQAAYAIKAARKKHKKIARIARTSIMSILKESLFLLQVLDIVFFYFSSSAIAVAATAVMLGLVFDYLDSEWKQHLDRVGFRKRFDEMGEGLRELWTTFIRRMHKLSNKGLKNVYDVLKTQKSSFSGEGLTGMELFARMQTCMISSMESMVKDLNSQLQLNLKGIWKAYVELDRTISKKGKEGGDGQEPIVASGAFLSQDAWHLLCTDNLIVEVCSLDAHEAMIVEQAVVNAVKPLEIVNDSKEHQMITAQIKLARQNILDSKDDIIRQHKEDIESKLFEKKKYLADLLRDMGVAAGRADCANYVSGKTFLEKYMVARASIRNEGERLEERKYEGEAARK